MLNTASWVAGGKEALIKMKASENVQHQFREFRFSVLGPDGTELELKPKLHQFLSTDIVNTFYVVFAAENNSNNIFATSNQINVIEPYSLAENEYLARVTVSNHGKSAIFSGPTSLFEVANAGHYTWASYQPDRLGADPAIHVQFSADKDPGKITKVKVTARYKRADLLSYNGFTKAIEGATVLEVPLTMDVSHKDEESGKVYVNISATGSEAQKADVAAGVQESKDYTDEKLKELLDSLYPPVNGTTTLTVYASGDKTWWHFNSLEIYLASGQRLYPLYYENVNSATASTGGDNKIKLVLTKDTSATLTLQPSTFFDSYELKDGEYLGNLILAEAFGQTTTQSNNASSNIFSTDNYGLYVVPTASESAAFGIEITGELQQIAKISLRSPRQASYVPPKIRATCVFDDTTLNAPEVETNSDINGTFVFPFAEEAAGDGEDIDLSNYVTLDGAESITGVKTFAATPVITNAPAADTDAVNKAYVDKAIQDAALEGEDIDTSKLVTTDTAQSITGAKSFTAPVTVATPTADDHAATKAYVDQALEEIASEVPEVDTSNLVTLDGAETITGIKTFSVLPQSTQSPSNEKDLITKKYVDDIFTESGIFNTTQLPSIQLYDLMFSHNNRASSSDYQYIYSGEISDFSFSTEQGPLYLKQYPRVSTIQGNPWEIIFILSLDKVEHPHELDFSSGIPLSSRDVKFTLSIDPLASKAPKLTLSSGLSFFGLDDSSVSFTNYYRQQQLFGSEFKFMFSNSPLITSISFNTGTAKKGISGFRKATREFNNSGTRIDVVGIETFPSLPYTYNLLLPDLNESEKQAIKTNSVSSLAVQNIVDLKNDQDIDGIKTFTTLPQSAVTPTLDAELVTKKYVDTAIAALKSELSGS